MFTKAVLPSLLSVVFFPLACDVTGPPAGLPYATASLTCGPVSGLGTAIILTRDPIASARPTYPFVNIVLSAPVSALAGRTLPIDASRSISWASYHPGPVGGEDAFAGRVSVERVDSARTVHGEVALLFASRRVVGTFTAQWIPWTGGSIIVCPAGALSAQ